MSVEPLLHVENAPLPRAARKDFSNNRIQHSARANKILSTRQKGSRHLVKQDLASIDQIPTSNKIKKNHGVGDKFSVQWADGSSRSIPHSRLFGKAPGKRLYGAGPVLHFPTVACMTALPDRLGLRKDGRSAVAESTIQDLFSQESVSAIFLSVPLVHGHPTSVSKEGSTRINKELPKWLSKYEEKVYILRTAIDYGPSTRIIGCMFAVPAEYENIVNIEVSSCVARA